MAVDGGVKVAAGVDLVHQLTDDGGAGLALIAGVGGQDGLSVVIEAVEGHHVARIVVVHLDLRVDAQQHGAHAAVGGLLDRGGGAAGAAGGRRRAGAAAAGGQGGQGQGSGQGQPKQLGSEVLFHLIHLRKYSLFCVLC